MMLDIYVIDLEGGAPRRLTQLAGVDNAAKWTPDGNSIGFISQLGTEIWSGPADLALVQADGVPMFKALSPWLSRASGYVDRIESWTSDGRKVYVEAPYRMKHALFEISVADGKTRVIAPGNENEELGLLSCTALARRCAYVRESPTQPPDVYVADLPHWKPRRLTDLNPSWCALVLPDLRRVSWRSADGIYEIEGLLLRPQNSGQSPLPLLTVVTGGPSMVTARLNIDYMYPLLPLAQAGYAVFVPMSRGRAGYGRDFQLAIRNERSYIDKPLDDVFSGIDQLIAQGVADGERLGIMGFSYGATLTINAVARSERFKAALYGEGSNNFMVSEYYLKTNLATGFTIARDILGLNGESFYDPLVIRQLFDMTVLYRLQSVKTPIMMEATESGSGWIDDRMLYRGLKHFNVPVEFYVYPRSAHGWDEPQLILDGYQRQTAWWDRWVKTANPAGLNPPNRKPASSIG